MRRAREAERREASDKGCRANDPHLEGPPGLIPV
jgi:hypothetical protein